MSIEEPQTEASADQNFLVTGLSSRAALDREAGYRTLAELQDETARAELFSSLEAAAPGFADWIVTALFGGTYQRDGLSPRDRQLVNLGALTALGGVDPQLAGHVRTGLRVGMTRDELIEVFVHLAPYVGVPKALAGLRVATAALAEVEAGTGATTATGTGTGTGIGIGIGTEEATA